jgi:5'-deoxynucleotidase YfbR-like HD superfamily hydrolase
MNERLAKLDEALKKLETGSLDKQSLDHAVKLARQIYEQWIILQHEYQEDEEDPIVESFLEIKTPFKNTRKEKEEIKEEIIEILTDERVSENQTTLIDIIEEIQEDISINELISQGKTKESLAQKHAKKAIADIERSIGLNQRFSFIKNLFENNKEAYNDAVKKLNSCASFLEADDYIHNVLMPKYKWDENTVHVIKFIDIIERRYLPH